MQTKQNKQKMEEFLPIFPGFKQGNHHDTSEAEQDHRDFLENRGQIRPSQFGKIKPV